MSYQAPWPIAGSRSDAGRSALSPKLIRQSLHSNRREAPITVLRRWSSLVGTKSPEPPFVAVHERGSLRFWLQREIFGKGIRFQLSRSLSVQSERTTTHTRDAPSHEESQCAARHKSDSVMAVIPRPAQERFEPATVGAWKVAPQMGNG